MFDCETGEDLTSQLTYNGIIRQVDPSSRDWKISPAAFRNTISIVQGKAQPDLEALGGELKAIVDVPKEHYLYQYGDVQKCIFEYHL